MNSMRKLVFFSIATLIVSAICCGCAPDGGAEDSREASVTSVRNGNGVKVNLSARPREAPPGSDISLALVVYNTSGENRAFGLPDSLAYEFAAFHEKGTEVWRRSGDRAYLLPVTSVELEPGESKSYRFSFDTSGWEPGNYTVEGAFLGMPDLKPRVDIEITTEPSGGLSQDL